MTCFKITVRVRNLTLAANAPEQSRDDALMYSLVSAHTILSVEDGEFVSLLDPPESLKDVGRGVQQHRHLAGAGGRRGRARHDAFVADHSLRLSADRSGEPGSLFDGTEIDEILSLRILTLTDDEKQEMRQSDDRAREILERTENMPAEQFMKLHGALRGLQPRHVQGGGAMNEWEWQLLEDKTLARSSRDRRRRGEDGRSRPAVSPQRRRHSRHRAAGQIATIESIEQDYEGKCACLCRPRR